MPRDGFVNALSVDRAGGVWIGTDAGLARLDPLTGAVTTYVSADGLQSNEFNFGAAFADGNGRLHFGGVNGLTSFRPEAIGANLRPPPVVVDPVRVKRVVDNLLGNAVKYTYPGGSVRLELRVLDGEVVTSVHDTGQGLDENDLAQVFHSFRTLSAQPTGGETSTGLGLAIARGIVEMRGGRIWVQSEKGRSATFSFALPIAR